ncbi:MAG TPA: TlpA disulfide reductase family protein, partial [Polyangiaceae bacterium]|nr:TlpA disulfide reductase family protein [Polyangiaceae bacterium]
EASIERALSLTSPATLYNEPTAPREPLDMDGLRFVGMDDGPVPDFSIESHDGRRLKSEELVGREPFVVVFFATWCQVCDMKLPVLKRVLDELGPITTIMVSADDAETWPHVPGYLKEHDVKFPVVSALAYPRFTASYNPFQAVPLVVVVGQNGGLVDYQMGFADTHQKRLSDAIRVARSIGPLKAGAAASPGRTGDTGAKAAGYPEP